MKPAMVGFALVLSFGLMLLWLVDRLLMREGNAMWSNP